MTAMRDKDRPFHTTNISCHMHAVNTNATEPLYWRVFHPTPLMQSSQSML